jgi:NAD(P)-dependent dehydrogenase (short-subunit alcohol dehydrogenase family)
MQPCERSVLLVGATGAFGERLAAGLIRSGIAVIAVARNTARLEKLARQLGTQISIETCERSRIDTPFLNILRSRHPGLYAVADASGPFQASDDRLPRAAIGAHLHYVDLADARDFVGHISDLDQAARSADIAVLSGASSTPALSHAVLDWLVADARTIMSIDVSIAPGNRAPRGLSVVQAILSTVGQPVRVFRGGRWSEHAGWSLGKTVTLPGIGKRPVALCETPDLDLLVARYHPTVDAIFRAGLELSLLHYGVAALGLFVRLGLVKTLTPLARPLRTIADLLKPFGSDRGGMRIDARLVNDKGDLVHRVWTLSANAGAGPYIPTLPALAALKMLADNSLSWRGAAACAGIIPYDVIAAQFTHHGITAKQCGTATPPPLMKRLLGADYDILPAVIRNGHDVSGVLVLEGRADATSPDGIITAIFSRVFRFPRGGANMPLRVEMRGENDGSETWTRIYPDVTMRSNLRNADPSTQCLDEVFGPIAIRLKWRATDVSLTLSPIGARLFGIPLPSFLCPRSIARETVDNNGRFQFDVDIAMPLIGPIVRYRGYLVPLAPDRG